MVSHKLVGSITQSYRPASTEGAAFFSANQSGNCANSDAKSQPVPCKYSQPRPTGGAVVDIDSNPASSTAMASTSGLTRTRC